MTAVSRIIRMGMVGGGPGAFIGPVHRMAAQLDGRVALVAGVFSSDADRSRQQGRDYGLAPERVYTDFRAMIETETQRDDGIDFLAIVTPNALHYPVAAAALAAGFDVMSEKPATATLGEAQALARIVRSSGRYYGLTFTYTGYAMLREARTLCRSGRLGAIRKIVVDYSQGWLSSAIERTGHKQASWRTDPALAGIGGCIGDIGVHAFHLAEFVSGRRVVEICADLSTMVEGRPLDDDCNVLLRFDNGASGVLIASQIATGDRNGLRLRVWGEEGGLDWSHERPELLSINWREGPSHMLHAGSPDLSPDARRATRLPMGHPEGFIEAFATLYRDFATAIATGNPNDRALVPDIADGVRSMEFIACAIDSSRRRSGWVSLPPGAA